MKVKTMYIIFAIFIIAIALSCFTTYNITKHQDSKLMYAFSTNTIGSGPLDTSSEGGDKPLNNVDCQTAPTISESARDAEQQATAVASPTYIYRVEGEYYTSEPSLNYGDKVQVLAQKDSYIDELVDLGAVGCGANTVAFKMYDYSAPTVEIKEDSSVLTDSATGGANNGSSVSEGGSQTFDVFFTGADKDSTGDFVYIVELSSTQNVSSISLYNPVTTANLEEVDVPDFYANTLSSPKVMAFKVPAIVGAKEIQYKLTFVAKSGKGITGAVYTTAYVGEPVPEDDGTISSWGIAQIDGDSDYEATFDYDFLMN